ncbi:2'-5' RNA ligase family protein [Gracilimonas sediminicola]|uniref:2'-5' RNA ligase family protein n=1 Tax=Gracilimonas sediminicola TaxID=2952158 RepID=A0A9X2RIC6_9BACT|nr:2'-5' RNA ligase family protein [Gracilimonas sediminicola]MCP9292754.1 2'-5' RNA ligase family protein [Gracilimonas sediminicola]
MSKSIQLPLFTEDIRVNEFLILIEPPKNVTDYVSILKKELKEEFGSFKSGKSKAHITVSNFLVTQKRMDDVLAKVQRRVSLFSTFEMRLQDFRVFESGNTFYIGVQPSHTFNSLISEFKSIKKEVVKTTKFYSSETPHLTIGRNFNTKVFRQIKDRYLEKPFFYTFDVRKLTVLTRSNSKENYELYSHINLQN